MKGLEKEDVNFMLKTDLENSKVWPGKMYCCNKIGPSHAEAVGSFPFCYFFLGERTRDTHRVVNAIH